jgi:hypothetical protein
MSDYNYYIRLNSDSLITYAYVKPRNQDKEDADDIPYKVNQSKYWELPSDIYNQYNEYKWKFVPYADPDLEEQTEPTLIWWKNDLLEKCKDYYLNNQSIRQCTITRADIQPVNYPISRDYITDANNAAASGTDYIYKDEATGQDIPLTNAEISIVFKFIYNISSTNRQHFIDHKRAINALTSNTAYDCTTNYLVNQVLDLDAN